MCGHFLRGNRETSERCLELNHDSDPEAGGKVNNRPPLAGASEESDGNIVPEKSANKDVQASAESMEGRAPTKRNSEEEAATRMQSRSVASNGLDRVRERSEADKTSAFSNLFHFLKVDLLRESFYRLNRSAAPGLDGVNWKAYAQNLETRLPELERELHQGSYRATPAKRTYLTKPDGRKRPLGMQAIEDKVVQQACVTILNEVYEPCFSGFSYGSRPGRKPHDALDALHEGISRRKINSILDSDIEGFFDHLPHDVLMEIISRRIKDRRLLRLIRKWLQVGWVEDGQHHLGTIGTPQGSVISPLLANIFLDAVLDKWSSRWRREHARGEMIIVRYVDDVVFGFQYENEARTFLQSLREQLAANGLKLHPDKTRLIEFGRFALSNRRDRGDPKPESFNFLGFTHSCGTNRKGWFCIRRKTEAKRLRQKIAEVKAELIKRMHAPLGATGKWLASVIRGVTAYIAVPGNMNAARAFYTQVSRHWMRVIRRRSQKARSRWTWERFYRLQNRYLTRPRVVHPYPSVRFHAKHSR
jgi:RNA-directed DNA polymerase